MKTFILTALSLLLMNPALASDPMPIGKKIDMLDKMYEATWAAMKFCKTNEINIHIDETDPNTPLQLACKRFEQSSKQHIKKATNTNDWDNFLAIWELLMMS